MKVKHSVSVEDLERIEELKKSPDDFLGVSPIGGGGLSPASCVAWLVECLERVGFRIDEAEFGVFCRVLYGLVDEELLWLKLKKE